MRSPHLIAMLAALTGPSAVPARAQTRDSTADTSATTPDSTVRSLADLLEHLAELRLEYTAPEFGWTSIRFPGQSGQHTRVLVDGLPLFTPPYGGFSPGGMPALDIERVEVIEGPATARFGLAALGGVINLVSRLPDARQEFLVSATSPSAADAQALLSHAISAGAGASLFVSGHAQQPEDVDGDGWADLAQTRRFLVRPRFSWRAGDRRGVAVVSTLRVDGVTGGPMAGIVLPAAGEEFTIENHATHLDGGVAVALPAGTRATVHLRAAATGDWGRQRFGPVTPLAMETGRHHTLFTEASVALPHGRATWLVGAALGQDAFRSHTLEGFNYSHNTAGLFALANAMVGSQVTLEAGARCDWHSRYGTFCNPRVSALLGASAAWSARLTAATGVYAPTPFTDETEGVPWERLVPFATRTIAICDDVLCASDSGSVQFTAPLEMRSERARFASLDVLRRLGAMTVSAGALVSTVERRIMLWDLNIFEERPQLLNAAGPKRSHGARLRFTYRRGGVALSADYLYLVSTLAFRSRTDRVESPLTPRHSGALALAWTLPGVRAALDVHVAYTGRQAVLEDPYRATAPPFTTVDLGMSRRIGRMLLFVVAENLSDTRQTRHDPLLMSAPDAAGRWTTEVWGPLSGRSVRAGIRCGL
jgi:iron complex outermembrane receptor protein